MHHREVRELFIIGTVTQRTHSKGQFDETKNDPVDKLLKIRMWMIREPRSHEHQIEGLLPTRH